MKKAFDDYTRLAGGTGLSGSLWQGPDHLLVIEGRGFLLPFREVYRRIDFQNIQALSLARTRKFGWFMAMWVAIFLIFLLIWWLTFRSDGWDTSTLVLVVPVTLAALALLIHLERGSTCVCCLQTAVLSLRLKPLRRMKKALPVLNVLHGLCEQHQGVALPPPATAPGVPVELTPLFQGRPEWLGSRLAQWAMVLLIAWGALFGCEMFVTSVIYLMAHLVLAVVVFGMLLVTVAQMARRRAMAAMLVVVWSAMGVIALAGLTIFVTMVILTSEFRIRQEANTQFDYAAFERMAAFNFHDAGYLAWWYIALGALGLIFGAMGMPLAIPRGKSAMAVPSPKVPEQPPATLP